MVWERFEAREKIGGQFEGNRRDKGAFNSPKIQIMFCAVMFLLSSGPVFKKSLFRDWVRKGNGRLLPCLIATSGNEKIPPARTRVWRFWHLLNMIPKA